MKDQTQVIEIFKNNKVKHTGKLLSLIIMVFLLLSDLSASAQAGNISSDSLSQSLEAKKNRQIKFVKAILSSSKDIWYKLFNDQVRKNYDEPKVVFYSGKIETVCSYKIASGPFYCSSDKTIYVDLSFYDELISRFPGSADFAMIYLVTHQVGHHVQNLLGNPDMIGEQENEMNEIDLSNINNASELQADFYAGVWAHYNQKMKNFIITGDMEEAMYAVSTVGSERMNRIIQGYMVPDGFNHSTSSQRVFWFNKGFSTGDILQGDTFKDPNR